MYLAMYEMPKRKCFNGFVLHLVTPRTWNHRKIHQLMFVSPECEPTVLIEIEYNVCIAVKMQATVEKV